MKVVFWALYAFLLVIRLIISLVSTGYIHPDEFFQNPEASSAFIFSDADINCLKTWEFNSPQIRSLTIPLLTTGIPFALVKFLTSPKSALPPPLAMFWGPRMIFFLMSMCLDACIMIIGKRFTKNFHWRRCLLFHATAWPILTFGVRSFSNTIELDLLAILLCVVANPSEMSYTRAIAVPLLGALGVFNRFTFVAFAAPLALYHVFKCVKTYDSEKKCYITMPLSRCCGLLAASVLSFCISVAALVCSDTYLFTGSVSPSSLVIAPLNFLLYNSNPANLALHGTHPRWLHVAVNFPLLVLPLLPSSIIHTLKSFASEFRSKWRRGPFKALPALSASVIMSSLAILSAAPHQELRFLLPLIVPVLILTFWDDEDKQTEVDDGKSKKKEANRKSGGCFGCLFILWMAFNMIFTGYFGFAQQGGVIPSLISIGESMKESSHTNVPQNIIYWHTYMPPRHLLSASRNLVNLTDLASAPETRLIETVDEVINTANMKRVCEELWVVVPSVEKSANGKLEERQLVMRKVFVPHIGLDNNEIESYKSAKLTSSRSTFENYAGLKMYHRLIGACGNTVTNNDN